MELKQLTHWLRSRDFREKQACIGFDGFVDRVLRVVDKRLDNQNVTYVKTLSDYGQMLMDAAGLSLNIELMPSALKLGGNGPIMANAIAAFGSPVSCLGAFGLPSVEPIFSELANRAELYSFSQPGHTDAYQFDDGKIIASVLQPLNDLNWECLEKHIGLEKLEQLFDKADLIAMNNWTMIPCMTAMWKNLQKQIFPKLSSKTRTIFIDLADPSKRMVEDLREALETMKDLTAFGRVLLSCNLREAVQIAGVLGIDHVGKDAEELCRSIQTSLGIHIVSVHTLKNATYCEDGESKTVDGFYTQTPKISVGGGDHFNAGLAVGIMNGLPLNDALLLGNAVSGYYVRTGESPSAERVADFLSSYLKED